MTTKRVLKKIRRLRKEIKQKQDELENLKNRYFAVYVADIVAEYIEEIMETKRAEILKQIFWEV